MRSPPIKKRETGLFKEVWRAYNDLIDFARELAVSPNSRGIRVSRTANGTLLVAEPSSAEEGFAVRMFRLKSVQDDYVTCREWDGTTEREADVLIAKPFDLRVTGWNGQTVVYQLEGPLGGATRTISYAKVTATLRKATGAGITEDQAVRPFYVVDRTIIFAARPKNGTGVDAADTWIDINTDGRAFAKIA